MSGRIHPKWKSPGVFFAALSGVILGVGLTAGTVYGVSRTALQARYFAKNLCSCLFITGQTEAFCRDYSVIGPAWLLAARVDVPNRRIEVTSFAVIRAHARYLGPRAGCTLDP